MFKHNNFIEDMFATQLGKNIYNRVLDTVNSNNMSQYIDNGVVLGFSGGADSVFLLCFLIEYKRRENKDFPLLAVHVNHGIRGDEAKRDEEFSRSFAESVGVEFESYFVDVPKISSEIGAGLEETARNARYSIFNEIVCGRNNISAIAVAHNATDNSETVIMNKIGRAHV